MDLGQVRGLALSSHPAPTVAVTTMTTVLVAVAGNTWQICLLAAVAVLTGQLSIGWSNDRIDAARDAQAGRSDKPAASGSLSLRVLTVAMICAAVLSVPFSLSLGWRSGLAHLLGVGCGWWYNLGAKSSAWSPVPYLIAFGALPSVATLAMPAHPWPPIWATAAAALIGVGAHFANVLPDLIDDTVTGVRGLPHHWGAHLSAITSATCVVGATLIIVVGTGGSAVNWWGMGVAFGLGTLGVASTWRSPRAELAFHATMAVAALDIALIALSHKLR